MVYVLIYLLRWLVLSSYMSIHVIGCIASSTLGSLVWFSLVMVQYIIAFWVPWGFDSKLSKGPECVFLRNQQ